MRNLVQCVAPMVLLSLTGCSWTVRPPAHPSSPVNVYLTDYGRHTSLILPTPDNRLAEYAFGDWDFFALGHAGFLNGIRALTCSDGSTLARRTYPFTDDPADLKRWSNTRRLVTFRVDAGRARALALRLAAEYDRFKCSQIRSDYTGMLHVRSDRPYSLCHNCNHVTAGWLRALGCRVDGATIFSKFKLDTPALAAQSPGKVGR